MAPRTRSNRTTSLEKGTILDGGEFNTKGFSALPAEIYLEIISYLPAIPVPTHEVEQAESDTLGTRRSTLFSLSQTCRSLRRTFLKYLWERIEVLDGMQTSKGCLPTTDERTRASRTSVRLKLHAEELIRQLEIVTVRDPSLAEYVNIANVVVTYYSAEAVLREVAKSFSLFPNLHTVQLELMVSRSQEAESAFEGYRYPQIRLASLTWNSLFFSKLCPELRSLFPYLTQPFLSIPRNCPTVEVLGTCIASTPTEFSAIGYMKNLRDVSVVTDSYFRPRGLESLLLLPQLHTIRIRMDKQNGVERYRHSTTGTLPTEQQTIDAYVEYAREHARTVKRTAIDISVKRKITVTFTDGRVQTFAV